MISCFVFRFQCFNNIKIWHLFIIHFDIFTFWRSTILSCVVIPFECDFSFIIPIWVNREINQSKNIKKGIIWVVTSNFCCINTLNLLILTNIVMYLQLSIAKKHVCVPNETIWVATSNFCCLNTLNLQKVTNIVMYLQPVSYTHLTLPTKA